MKEGKKKQRKERKKSFKKNLKCVSVYFSPIIKEDKTKRSLKKK